MSSTPGRLSIAMAVLMAAGAAAAQANRESLQQAWLHEVLDVDPVTAAASYRQIVESRSAASTDRWVASARLLELESLGLPHGATIVPGDLPPRLQQRIREDAQERDTRNRLVGQAERAPEQLPAAIRAERRTTLRPFVPESIILALEELRPGDRDLWRRTQLERRRSERTRMTTRTMQEVTAPRVLRIELAGQTQRADALRTLYFADWQPPPLPADRAAALQTVRTNLEQWRHERQLTGPQQEALRDLSVALDAAASRSPDDALRLLQRLPVYAERLLGAGMPATTADPATGRNR